MNWDDEIKPMAVGEPMLIAPRVYRDATLAAELGTVQVAIPVHEARLRNGMFGRAMQSISAQTYLPNGVITAVDELGQGAAATRQEALDQVNADWVAFLDSDDEMMPHHLHQLVTCAVTTGADYVYSWFMIKDAEGRERPFLDPFPGVLGAPFDRRRPVQTTITVLVRTELAKAVGFVPRTDAHDDPWFGHAEQPTPTGHTAGEDWAFTLGCLDAGAQIVHHPEITWWWHHHGANSSGQPGRGDA